MAARPWEERDPADYGSQDREGLPQFLLRAVASEERTGCSCPLSSALSGDSSSTEDHRTLGLQELKGSAGPGQDQPLLEPTGPGMRTSTQQGRPGLPGVLALPADA